MKNQYPKNRLIKKIIKECIINENIGGTQIFINNNLRQKTFEKVNNVFSKKYYGYSVFSKNIFKVIEKTIAQKTSSSNFFKLEYEPTTIKRA